MLPIYADAPPYQEVISELHALGFDLSGMFPVTLDPDLRVIEFDGVFVPRPGVRTTESNPSVATPASAGVAAH